MAEWGLLSMGKSVLRLQRNLSYLTAPLVQILGHLTHLKPHHWVREAGTKA